MHKIMSIAFLCLCLALAACGPKIVGEDTPKADITGTNPGSEPEDQLRYPLSGRSIEQRLYILNQPQTMINIERRQRDYFERRYQRDSTPNDYNNLQPRQTSPFRQ